MHRYAYSVHDLCVGKDVDALEVQQNRGLNRVADDRLALEFKFNSGALLEELELPLRMFLFVPLCKLVFKGHEFRMQLEK
jgi:hypothetical protein